MGTAPTETLNIFVKACEKLGLDSMINMMYVERSLRVLRPLVRPPNVVVLHRGRDEETTWGKIIEYRHIAKIRSKYDT